jgi:hypothetical protein
VLTSDSRAAGTESLADVSGGPAWRLGVGASTGEHGEHPAGLGGNCERWPGMRTLHVVSVSPDGSRALLGDDTGETYELPLDDTVQAALRAREARRTAPSTAGERAAVGPREIQARVRAGASPAEVATACGWPEDRVRRFAAPVLDERLHVANRARAALVRDDGMLELGTLSQVTAGGLRRRGITDEATWDAWRRGDGRWLVSTSWQDDAGSSVALWLLDPAVSSAAPLDDAARTLVERPTPTPSPSQARLAVVPDPSGDDGEGASDGQSEVSSTPRSSDDADDTPTGPIPPVLDGSISPGATHPARRARQHRRDDEGTLRLSEIADVVVEDVPRRRSSPRGAARDRPAVPSWDEIMFGRRS